MLLATQLPLLCGWNTAPSRALLLALVGLVLWDPRAMLGSSFWLSASATWLLVGQSLDSIRLVGLLRVQALLVFLLAPLSLLISIAYKAVRAPTMTRYWREVAVMTVQIIAAMILLGIASYVMLQIVVPVIAPMPA